MDIRTAFEIRYRVSTSFIRWLTMMNLRPRTLFGDIFEEIRQPEFVSSGTASYLDQPLMFRLEHHFATQLFQIILVVPRDLRAFFGRDPDVIGCLFVRHRGQL